MLKSAAIRVAFGKGSRSISTRFGYISVTVALRPVMFPPGRARLVMMPCATGSPTPVMTTGIVPAACLAASAAGVPLVRIRSTLC